MQFNVISLKKKKIKATAHGSERSPIHLQSLIVFFFFSSLLPQTVLTFYIISAPHTKRAPEDMELCNYLHTCLIIEIKETFLTERDREAHHGN